MKRINYILMGILFGTALLASNAFAGMNYIQYRQDFEASKQAPEPTRTEGSQTFYHRSRYVPQPRSGTPVNELRQDQGRWINKYDRSYWAPGEIK